MTTAPPAANPSNRYLETKVMTASPEELRLMLLDGAVKFCRQGRDSLAKKDYEGCHNGYSRCRAILIELISSMRTEVDPSLCEKVSSLYLFLIKELIESSHTKDVAKADKVIELLEYERETWVLLMAKLAEERSAAGAVRNRVDPGQSDAQPLSVSG
jgi:flagellar secretion chaperone FliS